MRALDTTSYSVRGEWAGVWWVDHVTHTHCRFGETPTSEQVDEFKRVSSHFFTQHPGEIIGELWI